MVKGLSRASYTAEMKETCYCSLSTAFLWNTDTQKKRHLKHVFNNALQMCRKYANLKV